jgi:predicted AAA+ superfamily ATPase
MKEFNITGTCIPHKHYMVDTSNKIEKVVTRLIEKGKYFIINRPRQFGKTTTLHLLEKNYRISIYSYPPALKELEMSPLKMKKRFPMRL